MRRRRRKEKEKEEGGGGRRRKVDEDEEGEAWLYPDRVWLIFCTRPGAAPGKPPGSCPESWAVQAKKKTLLN